MKKIFSLLVIGICCVVFAGCSPSEDELRDEVAQLEAEIDALEEEKLALEEKVTELKVDAGEAKYIVTFKIKQSHFTLDISEHIKDAMNDITIQVPVDKEFYESVEIGDEIDDSFRFGSLIMKGSFGSWKVTVDDKEIQEVTEE